MKRGLTIFSKGAVYLLGLAALAMCAILLPELAREAIVEEPAMAILKYPFLVVAYIVVIPFFIALYQTHQLLTYIDEDKAFSELSVQALQNIKVCTVVFGGMTLVGGFIGNSIVRIFAPSQEVTIILILGCLLALIAGVIATFVALLQRLLREAIDMQRENDLTV